ncbi:hypothetical protein BaRGS_00021608, partial [Batillaria attramentaria]
LLAVQSAVLSQLAPSIVVESRNNTTSVRLPRPPACYAAEDRMGWRVDAAAGRLLSSQDLSDKTPHNLLNIMSRCRERPLKTLPADSTCGIPARNAYCVSSPSQTSVRECIQDFCEAGLPWQRLLARRQKHADTGDERRIIAVCGQRPSKFRPGSQVSSGDYAYAITAGPGCFFAVDPNVTPVVGDSGSFTVTAWVWIDFDGHGTLLEKSSSSGTIILQILVGPEGVNVSYASASGLQAATFDHPIVRQTWTHLAVQVYDRSVSLFVNGLGPGYTAVSTQFVAVQISDSLGTARVGQSFDGTSQYLGRVQDVRFYSTALSNREVQEIYSGSLPEVRIQSNCRCPAARPRVKPQDTRYCLPNGVPDNAADAELRISRFSHPLEFANDIDGNSVWISKFYLQDTPLTLEVDLGDEFQMFCSMPAHMITLKDIIAAGFYSPLPKAVSVERYVVERQTWEPWQYYAEDCIVYFNLTNNGPLSAPDSVNCLRIGGNGGIPSPYSAGNITFSLLAPAPVARPEYDEFFTSEKLQQFVMTSGVRVTFREHFHVINIRHNYYALYDFGVTGRCECNGHAASCVVDPLPYRCQCSEESHTQGDRCSECQPLFNMKPFRKGDRTNAYNCQLCECYDHADSCVYNATLDSNPSSWTEGGGGVCVNCQHNTEGRFCDTCIDEYFRPTGKSLYDSDVCSLCNCNAAGTVNANRICEKDGGQCECKTNATGRTCDRCVEGNYNLQASNPNGCTQCDCVYEGTVNGDISCDQTTGNCYCKQNVRGRRCDTCEFGYYQLEEDNPFGCTPCDCNPEGSRSLFCNPLDGQCLCKDNVQGDKCDQCISGYYNFSAGCLPCDCNPDGTQEGSTCNSDNGQCLCKANTDGRDCGSCRLGTYSFGSSPEKGCQDCTCDTRGTVNGLNNCNATGFCSCKASVKGQRCNQCVDNTWGLSAENDLGCQPCDCDPSGTQGDQLLQCEQQTGECTCLPERVGRRCDDCQAGSFVVSSPGGGCLDCECDYDKTLPDTSCDTKTGQCQCRTNQGASGRDCTQCQSGFYLKSYRRKEEDLCPRSGSTYCYLCDPCNCLAAGRLSEKCDNTGTCLECKELVQGKFCEACKEGSSNLEASNPYGCSTTPSQQPAPVHQPLSPTSMILSWGEPDDPNGVIEVYRLYRNGTLIYTHYNGTRRFTDTGLQAYTLYSYQVEAVNAHGSAFSPNVFFRTNPGSPSADMVLSVTDIETFSARFVWNRPSEANGPELKYELVSNYQNQSQTRVEWEGQETQALLETLRPYHSYNMTVRACTAGGCSESAGVQFTTKAAPPSGMQPPQITALSSTVLSVKWDPPSEPNGIIIFYELWIRGLPRPDGSRDPVQSRIFHPSGQYNPLDPESSVLEAPATAFNITDLRPFTVYEFQVLAENSAGKAASPWTAGRTLETHPLAMPAPAVVGVGSTQLSVTWQAPPASDARGNITVYRLYQNMIRDPADTFASPTYWELTPYTEYTFKVEACNNIGCVNSTASTGRTLSAAPEGMAAPDVDGYNSTAMEIRWKEPASPNGPTPIYTVQKTNIAISYPASFVPGTRFSGGGYYTFPAETLPQNVDFTGIRFRFRLREARGLLMFAASENMDEFIAVVFTGGRPRFMYDTSGCPVSVEINVVENDLNTTFDDGEVHTLQVRRNGTSASILVDGIYRGDGSPDDSACQLKQIIGRMTALYVGGVPKDLPYQRSKDNYPLWQTWNNNFQGCIHKIEILKRVSPVEVWEELQWNQAESHELAFLNWQGCPTNLETESASAIHFMGKGYAKITTCKGSCLNQLSGNDTVIKFRMRTWLHTGNLFFAHGGRGIYMLAYLLQGRLHYVFSDGITTTTVTYDNPQDRLCDGRWRHITLSKRNQEGTLSIESVPVATSGDASRYMRVSLTSDIFLGGIKPDSDMSQFLQENQIFMPAEGFGGCMAKFTIDTIDNVQVDKIEIRDLINVNLDGCPPFHQPDDTCQAGLVTQIYHGADTLAYDTGLLPYTDYIYRVVAENDVGEVTSPWGYGRTREGRPVGVRGPTNVRAISGYMIEVEWNEPQSTSGLLTMTIISAYNLDQPDLPPVQTEISNVDTDASNITDVTPNTNYEIRISACTSGGCTESEEGATVLTPVEAPEEVAAPTAVATATTLNVMWEPPAKPNGNITGYFLYMDGVQVYAGGKQEHLVSDLQVYTAYQFYVRACTIAGCTDGPVVSLSTAQLPPTLVKPPRLQVLGTRSIEVNWEEPEQLNGVLERYLVLVSTLQEERGEVFHNTTDFYPQHVLTDLLAGTTYYISVGACTGGGCAISNASRATTEESSPEGVPAPVVTSPNSSRLTVIWDEPEFPNGQIISYTLFHNGVNVMEGLARVYHVDGLQPYSRHTFRVQACTARGCGTSAETEARTQQEAPQGTVVATARVLDARTVSVRFTSPAQPNGLLYFDIFFQGLFYVDPENWNYTTVMDRRSLRRETAAYTDYTVSQLIPNSEYRIQVVASNTKGSITSNTVPIELYPGSPDGMKPPTVVSDTPTSLQVTWEPVGRVNSADSVAYVVQFRRREGDPISDEIETINFSYRKSGLTAFTSYQFRILATTKRFGAAVSPWVEATTQEDRPTGVDPPRVATVQERSIDLEWSPPRVPNGVLLVYRLYQNQTLIEEIPANETTYTVDQLTPYQVYSFEIEACTVAGCTKSAPSSMVRTLEAVADGIAAPEVRPLTPAIIEVKWTEPAGPNGDITQYMLERRLASGGDITVIATFAPAAAKSYIDDSTALSPFTTYSYRVKVVNGAGAAEGPWANITTLSSRPGGVLSPALQVLGPTQLEVTWSPPAQPNGVIEYYVIRWAGTQREVRNFTELRVVLDDLVPYTVYSVTVTACTNGGCTESLPASARTDAAVPSGVDPPSATAVSQSAISITWTAPSRPGGPNLRYELSRKKVRQPLESSATDIDIWQTVYQGTLLLYEDRGLPMFTTFVYRVTAFNSVGHLTSNVSAEVTTFGGYPRQAPRVAAVAVSHLEINVNWTLPDPVNLQGDVQRLTLTAQSLQDNVTVYPEVGTDNYTLQDLTANTNYAIRLTVTIFGGAAITSEPVAATTLDGAPEGIDPPVLDVVSDTALRVSWTVPARPNGEIIAYNVIVNGETAPTGSTQPGSLILTELQPYTVYEVQ